MHASKLCVDNVKEGRTCLTHRSWRNVVAVKYAIPRAAQLGAARENTNGCKTTHRIRKYLSETATWLVGCCINCYFGTFRISAESGGSWTLKNWDLKRFSRFWNENFNVMPWWENPRIAGARFLVTRQTMDLFWVFWWIMILEAVILKLISTHCDRLVDRSIDRSIE